MFHNLPSRSSRLSWTTAQSFFAGFFADLFAGLFVNLAAFSPPCSSPRVSSCPPPRVPPPCSLRLLALRLFLRFFSRFWAEIYLRIFVRICQPDGFHGTEAQGFDASFSHYFDGQTSFEVRSIFLPLAHGMSFGIFEVVYEFLVLFFIERHIEVIPERVFVSRSIVS